MKFCGVSRGMSSGFACIFEVPYTVRPLKKSLAPFELVELHFPILFFWRKIRSVIITLRIRPHNSWGFNKRNSQEKLQPPCLVPFGKTTPLLLHQKHFQAFIQMALQTEKNYMWIKTHFVADTDAEENCFGIHFSLQMQTQLVLQFRGGRA